MEVLVDTGPCEKAWLTTHHLERVNFTFDLFRLSILKIYDQSVHFVQDRIWVVWMTTPEFECTTFELLNSYLTICNNALWLGSSPSLLAGEKSKQFHLCDVLQPSCYSFSLSQISHYVIRLTRDSYIHLDGGSPRLFLPYCKTRLLISAYKQNYQLFDRCIAAFLSNTRMYSFIHSSMALQPFVGPWPLLQFRNLS
jgi:hypothetical protein